MDRSNQVLLVPIDFSGAEARVVDAPDPKSPALLYLLRQARGNKDIPPNVLLSRFLVAARNSLQQGDLVEVVLQGLDPEKHGRIYICQEWTLIGGKGEPVNWTYFERNLDRMKERIKNEFDFPFGKLKPGQVFSCFIAGEQKKGVFAKLDPTPTPFICGECGGMELNAVRMEPDMESRPSIHFCELKLVQYVPAPFMY